MIARTTPASRPSPSRGGLRPAWTPTPHTRTSTHARKTRKTAPAHPNQDLTGPAPFMDDQHHQDEKCPSGRLPGPETRTTHIWIDGTRSEGEGLGSAAGEHQLHLVHFGALGLQHRVGERLDRGDRGVVARVLGHRRTAL